METRKFPANTVKLFASEKSAGKSVSSSVYGQLTMEEFSLATASKLDVCLLAVGGDFSLEYAEKLAAAGNVEDAICTTRIDTTHSDCA